MAAIINFLVSLTWQDVVDVLLCSYIVFRLYILFRGTAVLRVLIGILLLVVAQRFTSFLGLVLTSWAIQGITAAAALIIIVIFRNEIRSVLQARHLTAILWGSPLKNHQAPVETIAESLCELAQKRCGALLVIPGNNDLSDSLHSGTPLDCRITREALLSIFWPGNPLHDGAALIQDNRITQAGAVLPVSTRSDLPSHYGTRHRAALGLAERSDALILAVSEEHGTITAAVNGQLKNVAGREELTRVLQQHLQQHTEHHERSQREKKKLIAAAGASVALVISIWFGFTRGADTFMAFEVPIEYTNRDPALDIMDASVNTIKLFLGGSGSLVKSLQPEQVRVRIDLRSATPGINTYSITADQIQIPPGIFVRKIEPLSVDVVLDMIVQKKLPVQADWSGTLPEGLVITTCAVEPAEVLVEGPQHVLADTPTLYTEKIDAQTVTESSTFSVPIALSQPALRIISGPDRVIVRFTVERRAPQSRN